MIRGWEGNIDTSTDPLHTPPTDPLHSSPTNPNSIPITPLVDQPAPSINTNPTIAKEPATTYQWNTLKNVPFTTSSKPISTPEPVSAPEPVSLPKPVSAPEPISTPKPVSTPESVSSTEPVQISGVETEQEYHNRRGRELLNKLKNM